MTHSTLRGSTRRQFVQSTITATAGLCTTAHSVAALHQAPTNPPGNPVVIASGNGLNATRKAMELLQAGSDGLDAVIAGVSLVEDDPHDNSVGFGGLPNEDGDVELDASVMHGPTARGGAVAALRNIRHPSQVARLVMERTDHVLLVGPGALRFAKAHGFKEEELLTEESRRAWLRWKENLSPEDDWLAPESKAAPAANQGIRTAIRNHGTITCSALDAQGNLSGCTTTSGLAFKLAGRVGDSPILGAGLWVDNDVGAAGATGRGEANLLVCGSFLVVQHMREGASPEEACLRACQRVAERTKTPRLLDAEGRPRFNLTFYALDRQGRAGAAAIWSGATYALNTGTAESRLVPAAFLFRR